MTRPVLHSSCVFLVRGPSIISLSIRHCSLKAYMLHSGFRLLDGCHSLRTLVIPSILPSAITLAIGCNTMSIPVSGKAFGPLNGIASYAEASQSIVAYPDPASAIVKAALPVNEAIKSLEVLDNNDRAWQPAYKLNGTELNVDLKQLPAGSYYLRIVNVTGKHYLAKFTKE